MKNKIFLIIVVALLAVGCARGEQYPWDEEGRNLRITTTWREISPSYIYYVAISTDPVEAPSHDPVSWDRFYVVKWEDHNFFFKKPYENYRSLSSSSLSEREMVVTLSLVDDLGNPDILRVMVVSTDRGGNVEDDLDRGAVIFRPKQQSSKSWSYEKGGLLSLKIEVR